MQTKEASGRIRWMDCARAVAILAVVVDHGASLLYDNGMLQQATYFSIGLFMMLSGMTAWMTSDNGTKASYARQWKRIGRLFATYAIATFVIMTVMNGAFDLSVYLTTLTGFSAMSAMYYLFVLFQMMLLSPVLVKWCAFCNRQPRPGLWQTATLLALCAVSVVCGKHTYMLPLYGGGRYLFGATYLVVYYLGMALASGRVLDRLGTWKRPRLLAVSVLLWAGWLALWLLNILPFDRLLAPWLPDAINPPGVQAIVYALLTLLLCYALFTALERAGRLGLGVAKGFAWLGRYTLPIYLYHLLIRDWLAYHTPWTEWDIWMRRACFLTLMLGLPVLGAWLAKKIKAGYRYVAATSAVPSSDHPAQQPSGGVFHGGE